MISKLVTEIWQFGRRTTKCFHMGGCLPNVPKIEIPPPGRGGNIFVQSLGFHNTSKKEVPQSGVIFSDLNGYLLMGLSPAPEKTVGSLLVQHSPAPDWTGGSPPISHSPVPNGNWLWET